MIEKYFVLLLILLACSVQGNTDIDDSLERLRKMDVVLQDSVSYLIQQVSSLQLQMNNVTSIVSNQPNQTQISTLQKEMKLSEKKIIQLWMWRKEVDNRLNHSSCTMNITQLDEHLQPINHKIKTIKNDMDRLSQQVSKCHILIVFLIRGSFDR